MRSWAGERGAGFAFEHDNAQRLDLHFNMKTFVEVSLSKLLVFFQFFTLFEFVIHTKTN